MCAELLCLCVCMRFLPTYCSIGTSLCIYSMCERDKDNAFYEYACMYMRQKLRMKDRIVGCLPCMGAYLVCMHVCIYVCVSSKRMHVVKGV